MPLALRTVNGERHERRRGHSAHVHGRDARARVRRAGFARINGLPGHNDLGVAISERQVRIADNSLPHERRGEFLYGFAELRDVDCDLDVGAGLYGLQTVQQRF